MNISVYQGDDKTFRLAITDENDDVIDLTSSSLVFTVTDWRGNFQFSKSSENSGEIDIIDAPGGIADIILLPADTSGLLTQKFIHYIKYTNPAGKIYTILQGQLDVLDLGTLAFVRNELRNFQGDKSELNLLLEAQETTNEELNSYIRKAADFFNAVGFTTYYTYKDYPVLGNLIDGVAIQILQGKGILSARNMLTYTDNGGITVQDYDTYGRYVNLFNVFISKYYQQCVDIKRDINIDSVYGNIASPFTYINGEDYYRSREDI